MDGVREVPHQRMISVHAEFNPRIDANTANDNTDRIMWIFTEVEGFVILNTQLNASARYTVGDGCTTSS